MTDRALGYPTQCLQPQGDVNQDGVGDFYLAAPSSNGGTAPGQAYLIFGRAGGAFPAELDLTALDGTNGYVIDGIVPKDAAGHWGGGAGDINGDGIPDIAVSQNRPAGGGARTFILFGGSENLAALDVADGYQDGHIGLSAIDTATDGTRGFAINGSYAVHAVGDVNGDHVDDLVTLRTTDEFRGAYVVYGRDSTQGNFFPAAFELSSLLPANGGNGSEGFVIPRVTPTWVSFASVDSAGDVNNDGI